MGLAWPISPLKKRLSVRDGGPDARSPLSRRISNCQCYKVSGFPLPRASVGESDKPCPYGRHVPRQSAPEPAPGRSRAVGPCPPRTWQDRSAGTPSARTAPCRSGLGFPAQAAGAVGCLATADARRTVRPDRTTRARAGLLMASDARTTGEIAIAFACSSPGPYYNVTAVTVPVAPRPNGRPTHGSARSRGCR
jgi:hypothetical protein